MPKKFKQSSLQRGLLCFACLMSLVVIGCQRRDEVIAGVDIPIPEKMTKNSDKGFDPLPGFKDGQVSYQGKITPAEIFTFYQEVMAARAWQPTARFADQKNRIAYTKANRLVLIRYDQIPDGTTVLTVMVGTQDPPK
jgi:hypothetical protein